MTPTLFEKVVKTILANSRKILLSSVVFTMGSVSYVVYDTSKNAGVCRNCKAQAMVQEKSKPGGEFRPF